MFRYCVKIKYKNKYFKPKDCLKCDRKKTVCWVDKNGSKVSPPIEIDCNDNPICKNGIPLRFMKRKSDRLGRVLGDKRAFTDYNIGVNNETN